MRILQYKTITIKKIFLLIILFLIGWSHTSFATPPARVKLPDAVRASITFPAGRSPDYDGKFEIEVYCHTRFDIESIEIVINHSDEIIFEKDLPSFNGTMKAGKAKLWRIKGVIKDNPILEGKTIPASITLGITYLYPYNEGLKYIEQSYSNDILANKAYWEPFDEYKGKTIKIMKALPVQKPEYKDMQKQGKTNY